MCNPCDYNLAFVHEQMSKQKFRGMKVQFFFCFHNQEMKINKSNIHIQNQRPYSFNLLTINTIKWSPIEQEIEIFFFQISSVIITTSLVNSYRQKWRGSVQERTKFKNVRREGEGELEERESVGTGANKAGQRNI